MSDAALNPASEWDAADRKWKNLYYIGAIAALLQLASILASLAVRVMLGPKPDTALECFTIHQTNPFASVLRGDFLLLFLLGSYLGTFPALYVSLRRLSPVYTALATLFTFIAVTICFASESTFSMLYLGNQYATASTEAQRLQFLSAGEAVIASDMWHSSGAYVSGILLQGSGVIISIIMLRSRDFNKVTAISGLLGNALDLLQHLLNPFSPSISASIMPLMGVFYFIWFPMLSRDLFRLARRSSFKS